MFGRVVIPRGSTDRILVPLAAVQRFGQLEYVLVAQDRGPVRRFVRTGRQDASGAVDVVSGLEPGERVVVPAQ